MRLVGQPRIELLYKQNNLIIPVSKSDFRILHGLLERLGVIDLNKDYEVSISPKKKKRSLSANAYMWELCGKLADKLSGEMPVLKEDVYRQAIREVGVWQDDEVEPSKVKWRCTAWSELGTGWVSERVDFSADGSREVIRFYYGSSRYNQKQMSRLIDYIVEECKIQGIETMTPNELEELKQKWGAVRGKP